MVQQLPDFVCVVTVESEKPSLCSGMVQQLRARLAQTDTALHLISSPGFAVLDSGCGRSVIGADTLAQFRSLWKAAGLGPAHEHKEQNSFRFGNGSLEVSNKVIEMPISIAGKHGVIRAAVIRGQAPLLLSRPALKRLQARLDFDKDELVLFDEGIRVPLRVNEAGQYVVPVLGQRAAEDEEHLKPIPGENNVEPLISGPASSTPSSASRAPGASECSAVGVASDHWELQGDQLIRHHVQPRACLFCPSEASDCPVPLEQIKPMRETVFVQKDGSTIHQHDNWDQNQAHATQPMWMGRSVFQVMPPPMPQSEPGIAVCQWSRRQRRQLRASVKAVEQPSSAVPPDRFQVIEVFTPPRLAKLGVTKGVNSLTADRITGWDFRRPADRQRLLETVRQHRPELLFIGPPCTWIGGWFDVDSPHLNAEQRAERSRLIKLLYGFVADVAQIQLANGGHLILEPSAELAFWKMPRLAALKDRLFEVSVDLCAYGLALPDGCPVQKRAAFLVSHSSMRSLSRSCPGHVQHEPVVRNHPKYGSLARFASQYPSGLLRAMLRTVKSLSRCEALVVQACPDKECLVAARVRQLNGEKREQMMQTLLKLHVNLGHPSCSNLARVLKHGGASQEAIELAREVQCDVCRAQKPPTPPPPAQTHRAEHFNQRVGLDVKYLQGWQPNQKIPCLNVVDYASSYQIMVPLSGRATGEMIRQAFQERWVTWAGVPEEIIVDPDQANLSAALTIPQELAGAHVSTTAAEAHWQLGKVEVHGGWFGRILDKVLAEAMPHNRELWLECVYAAHCKNELVQVYGMTPAQYVFGRNPRIPTNLLDEPLQVIPATASLYEESLARQIAVRQAARKAVIELQDDKALRLGLQARKRSVQAYEPGARVAYWRTQKSHDGVIERGGRWYGPAIVLGYVGRNLVVIHKKQIFRCAPEQVRPSTAEEQVLVDTPGLDLIGIKQLLDAGSLQTKQYVDLVPEGLPPLAASDNAPAPNNPAPMEARVSPADAPVPPPAPETPQQAFRNQAQDAGSSRTTHAEAAPYVPVPSTRVPDVEYGPVRTRARTKTSPETLLRPQAMLQDDFAEMMQEVVPRLVTQALQQPGMGSTDVAGESSESSQTGSRGTKREASSEPSGPSEKRAAAESSAVPSDSSVDEALLCEWQQSCGPVEALVAAHINKRASKEIPASNNPQEFQMKVDESKLIEWNTLTGRHAVRLVLGREAREVKRRCPDRIMGSRFVCTWKEEEDQPGRVKSRWCLQGHLDPDLSTKALAGDLQSPTLSQLGRALLFQVIASKKWTLMLGDVKGAFLASGQLPEKYRPLFARLPAGGIPGVPEDALIEVLGRVYGLNDSPSAWSKTLNQALLDVGFERSRLDPCLYFMREAGKLTGIFGVHVDDNATGGEGDKYHRALESLKKRFEFRKWRLGNGDFCGANYNQDASSGEITMTQETFVGKLSPLRFSRTRTQDKTSELTSDEIRCFRAINGSLNWLATQSRPDLSTQVSFAQQSFPTPRVADAVAVNQAVRRAKQHAAMPIVYRSVPIEELTVMTHSDAAYANGRDGATQAGYVISFTQGSMHDGQASLWTPAFWKSYRLPRVVNSTLSAEAQAMTAATGMAEWALLLLSECLDGQTFLRSMWNVASRRRSLVVTDCKSLFDHVSSMSAPTLDDRRTALDIVILRESLSKTQGSLRWVPTTYMLADSLTKESPEAFDLLRGCIRQGYYQIAPESLVLQNRADERERRKQLAQNRQSVSE